MAGNHKSKSFVNKLHVYNFPWKVFSHINRKVNIRNFTFRKQTLPNLTTKQLNIVNLRCVVCTNWESSIFSYNYDSHPPSDSAYRHLLINPLFSVACNFSPRHQFLAWCGTATLQLRNVLAVKWKPTQFLVFMKVSYQLDSMPLRFEFLLPFKGYAWIKSVPD